MHLKSLLFAGALFLTSAGVSQNTAIISNFATADNLTGTNVSSTGWKAMGFTMGALPYDLTEVLLPVEFIDPNPHTIMEVALYSNNASDNPGTKLIEFDTRIVTTGTNEERVMRLQPSNLPFRTFRLQPNTTYWLTFRSLGPNGVDWKASSIPVVPSGVATHFGARWNSQTGTLPSNPSAVLNTYELQGTVRPSTAWYLQDPATGQIGVASYKNSHFINWKTFPQVVGSGWEVLDFGAYGNSIHADALLRNKATGELAIWYANQNNFFQFHPFTPVPPFSWHFKGSGFFGGFVEYPLFQNSQSGAVILGVHDGDDHIEWREFPKVPNAAWEIIAVGDTNDDGIADVMFRNKSTGEVAIWRTDGMDFTTWHVFPQVPSAAWDVKDIISIGNERGVIFQNKMTKQFAVWRLNPAGTAFTQWMPLRLQPDTKFNYKGFGYIELPF